MGRCLSVRHVLLLSVLLCAVMLLPSMAIAEESEDAPTPELISEQADTSFEGVYDVAGSTNTGKGFDAVVQVAGLGETIQFSARVMGVSVTTAGEALWNGPDEVTVPVSANVRIASGSGTVTLSRTGGGTWDLSGAGTGSVFTFSGFKDGSVTFAGAQRGSTASESELAEVTGVPEQVRSAAVAVKPAAPADTQGELETQRRANAAAALILVAFLLAVLEVVLGLSFL